MKVGMDIINCYIIIQSGWITIKKPSRSSNPNRSSEGWMVTVVFATLKCFFFFHKNQRGVGRERERGWGEPGIGKSSEAN